MEGFVGEDNRVEFVMSMAEANIFAAVCGCLRVRCYSCLRVCAILACVCGALIVAIHFTFDSHIKSSVDKWRRWQSLSPALISGSVRHLKSCIADCDVRQLARMEFGRALHDGTSSKLQRAIVSPTGSRPVVWFFCVSVLDSLAPLLLLVFLAFVTGPR